MEPNGGIRVTNVPDRVVAAVRGSPLQALADGGSLFSARGLETMLAQVVPRFPLQAVSKGFSWKSALSVPQPGVTVELERTMRLDSSEPATTKLSASIESRYVADTDSTVKIAVEKQSGQGEFLFDTTAGRMTTSKVQRTAELVILFGNLESRQTTKSELQLEFQPREESGGGR
jgi:hypothetical protein